ncbi:hypothetical protein CDD83_3940 [Cordyceps sp. RAO-2017]|nr:hypothetical protein CDD83_3940 [Cordyceps sp. RAO-2017]
MLLDLPGRYKTWVEAIGDMMTIAIRKHNDGGFHFDTLDLLARRVFKSMGVENSTQRELWVFKLAAVARMVAEEDENEVSNLFLRQHQLWIPMEEKMNKMAMSRDFDPAIRLDPTLWAPVIEKVADSVAGATCWGLLYHVLQQQQSWVPPLQDVARASGRESITRLLVEQQRLWCLIAREVDEAEGAGEPGAGALIGLMYAQQRSWLPILDELDQIELPDTKLFHQSPDLWASILDDLRHVW